MDDEKMLDAFYAWLDATSGDRPKSASGAVGYNEMEAEAFAAGWAAASKQKIAPAIKSC